MNVLSSLLYWIGNTIGYNPNTLKTNDKTIVGAINEVKDSVDEADTKIDGLSLSTQVVSVSKTHSLGGNSIEGVFQTINIPAGYVLSGVQGVKCSTDADKEVSLLWWQVQSGVMYWLIVNRKNVTTSVILQADLIYTKISQ